MKKPTDSERTGTPAVAVQRVVRPLPPDVQKHLAEIEAQNKQIYFEADPLVSRHMAWRRWGKAKTNQELSKLLMALRNFMYTDADCEGGIILEEIAWRINKRPNEKS